ncbi:hypothetical protein JCM8547_000120 [Rhodosporidiobolus lusitaniae]
MLPSISKLLPAIPTMSLGHGAAPGNHSMRSKLEAAARNHFVGIELFHPCLQAFAEEFEGETERDRLRAAAKGTKQIADEVGLKIICLQPLLHYDGLVDEQEHRDRLDEAVFRFELCGILGCDMIQVPATWRLDDGVTGDEEKIVKEFRELSDLGLKNNPPIRFAYEPMCWSTYAYTWQKAYNIVRKVDRPNFGIVLDTFQVAGYEYADPTLPDCVRPNRRERLAASLAELSKTVDLSKVLYLQIVDAERIEPPLLPLGAPSTKPEELRKTVSPYHVDGQQPRMSWSRNCRLFPCEEELGGFMPIDEVYRAFLELGTGFEGYVSFELFTRHMNNPDKSLPEMHAQRGWRSWEAIHRKLGMM